VSWTASAAWSSGQAESAGEAEQRLNALLLQFLDQPWIDDDDTLELCHCGDRIRPHHVQQTQLDVETHHPRSSPVQPGTQPSAKSRSTARRPTSA